jgi:uncharacterized membrane protein YeiH
VPEPTLLLALDLIGTFAFGLNGALTAIRSARVDLFGVVALGMFTAVGGGIVRDTLINSLPPATFSDWRYLAVAAGGALMAFLLNRPLERFASVIAVADAAGLSLFCVTGASKALDFGLGGGVAAILGVVTAVGGGTIRDVLVMRVPSVLTSGLYAVPALVGASITVAAVGIGVYGVPAAALAAAVCFAIRMLALRYDLNLPDATDVSQLYSRGSSWRRRSSSRHAERGESEGRKDRGN